jgi:hypothetical protein
VEVLLGISTLINTLDRRELSKFFFSLDTRCFLLSRLLAALVIVVQFWTVPIIVPYPSPRVLHNPFCTIPTKTEGAGGGGADSVVAMTGDANDANDANDDDDRPPPPPPPPLGMAWGSGRFK